MTVLAPEEAWLRLHQNCEPSGAGPVVAVSLLPNSQSPRISLVLGSMIATWSTVHGPHTLTLPTWIQGGAGTVKVL